MISIEEVSKAANSLANQFTPNQMSLSGGSLRGMDHGNRLASGGPNGRLNLLIASNKY
jgi:hypothetical protein